ncbi:MAG: hypothetical protein RR478_04930 [Bacilli bacterium]
MNSNLIIKYLNHNVLHVPDSNIENSSFFFNSDNYHKIEISIKPHKLLNGKSSSYNIEINCFDDISLESVLEKIEDKFELNVKLEKEIKTIIDTQNLLSCLKDNNNLTSSITTRNWLFSNITSSFSNRISLLYKLISNKNNDTIVKKYALRDIVECIGNYVFLIEQEKNYDFSNDDVIDILLYKNGKKMELLKFKDMKNNVKISNFLNYIDHLEEVEINCNNFIHKNGFEKIDPIFHYKDDRNVFDDANKLVKFFFICVILFDETYLMSSDYIDYLDFNMEPIENLQYWVSNIYANYIKEYYNDDEINIFKNNCQMDLLNETVI